MPSGIYFDGRTSARQDVNVTLGPATLRIETTDGRLLAEWPYEDIESLTAPDAMLRLGRRNNTILERLEVTDSQFAAEIDGRARNLDRAGVRQRRTRLKVVGWSLAATLSLLLVAWFGVPAIATRLAPLLPSVAERKLGEAVDLQLRNLLDNKKLGAAFDCGTQDSEVRGRAALDKLVRRLGAAAELPVPLRTVVVRRPEANAMALPGGRIYVFEGLIAKAESADEVAGVIAHEIGHVAHRDGTKSVLQAGGLSFLFGMLLGDFVGGGAVILAAKTVLQSSYSRETEAAADAYGAALMNKVGGNARALAIMLTKIGGATEPGMTILLDHPQTKARVAAINALAAGAPGAPMLSAAEWAALKRICAK